ncbi:MAG: S46 family peptidase [Pseudomonadota bacterium]
MKSRSFFAALSFFAFFPIASPTQLRADDAMYLAVEDQMPADEVKASGIHVSTDEIAKLALGGVPYLSSGCTGTFLSKDGLIATNYHCAANCVGTLKEDPKYSKGPLANIRNLGFVAASQDQEPRCPTDEVRIPVQITNVSNDPELWKLELDRTLRPKDWAEQVRMRREELRQKCRGSDKDIICDVVRMNTGPAPYYLIKTRRYRDVRLVWVPPIQVGKFGGETDNWHYPRQTGDFSFFRLYQDGKPYPPSAFAKASTAGFKPGDPQFMLGFPGTTQRNVTSFQVAWMAAQALPLQSRVLTLLMEYINGLYPRGAMQGPYAIEWEWIANYAQNMQLKADFIKKVDVVSEKRAAEEGLAEKTNLNRIREIFDPQQGVATYYPAYYILSFMTGRHFPAKSFLSAYYIWKWSTQDPDDMKRPDERFKSWNEAQRTAEIKQSDDLGTYKNDIKLMTRYFQLARELNVQIQTFNRLRERAEAIHTNEPVEMRMAKLLFAKTRMVARNKADRDRATSLRLKMFATPGKDLEKVDDSMLKFAIDISKEFEELRSGAAEPYVFELERANYLNNLAMGAKYPDANSTIRFVFSTVQASYDPIDGTGHFPYATTLTSLIRKDGLVKEGMDKEAFVVPAGIKKAQMNLSSLANRWYFDTALNDIPVNFITQHLITGGNSGSSVLNADGEVVGLAFDGTPESILDDVRRHPASRTISVDMRYIAFLGDQIYPDARRIIQEMGLSTD